MTGDLTPVAIEIVELLPRHVERVVADHGAVHEERRVHAAVSGQHRSGLVLVLGAVVEHQRHGHGHDPEGLRRTEAGVAGRVLLLGPRGVRAVGERAAFRHRHGIVVAGPVGSRSKSAPGRRWGSGRCTPSRSRSGSPLGRCLPCRRTWPGALLARCSPESAASRPAQISVVHVDHELWLVRSLTTRQRYGGYR